MHTKKRPFLRLPGKQFSSGYIPTEIRFIIHLKIINSKHLYHP